MLRRNPHALRVQEDAHCRHHRLEIQQRLALPHQHNIGLRRELCFVLLQRQQNLRQNFSGGQVANQSQLRRKAKMAIHSASRLRRNTNRLPPPLGMNTASTKAGFCKRLALSFPLFSVFAMFSANSVLKSLFSSALPKPNKYRTEPSAAANRCFTSSKATRASLPSRSRSAAGRFVICATSNFLSEYSA